LNQYKYSLETWYKSNVTRNHSNLKIILVFTPPHPVSLILILQVCCRNKITENYGIRTMSWEATEIIHKKGKRITWELKKSTFIVTTVISQASQDGSYICSLYEVIT
jgi:hypothetical protein